MKAFLTQHKVIFLVILYLCINPAITFPTATDFSIEKIINEVNISNIMNTIYDLVENKDINSPDKSYKSRYCLRVRDASELTDGACDNSADYIYNKFASYGLDVEYEPFIHKIKSKSSETQQSYKMRNVIATLHGKGQHSDMTYIICSHYDSIAGLSAEWLWRWKELPAPGADDNASGTSVVLEIARILSKYSFDFTIKFIAFSGEELGMFGSKYYAGNAFMLRHKIAGVINLDMIGYDPNELDIDVVSNMESEWLANAINYIRNKYNINIGLNSIVDPKMIYSDHSSFWKNGYSAVLINEGTNKQSGEYSLVNHTAEDTIDKINPELLLRTSKLVVATLAKLAHPLMENETYTDLAIDSLTLTLTKQKRISITANIKNISSEPAINIQAQIWLIPPENWLDTILIKNIIFDLDSMSSYGLLESASINSWGDWTVIVRINSDFSVFESDFTNNIAKKIISLSDEFGINSLLIYPNPVFANKNFGINIRYSLSHDARVTLSIYDLLGQLIYRQEFYSGENGGKRGPNNNIKLNMLSDLNSSSSKPISSGVYICQVTAVYENGESKSISDKLALLR